MVRNFAGVYFCGLAIFLVLRELIFAIRRDWIFSPGINFWDFQKVPSKASIDIFVFCKVNAIEIVVKHSYPM